MLLSARMESSQAVKVPVQMLSKTLAIGRDAPRTRPWAVAHVLIYGFVPEGVRSCSLHLKGTSPIDDDAPGGAIGPNHVDVLPTEKSSHRNFLVFCLLRGNLSAFVGMFRCSWRT